MPRAPPSIVHEQVRVVLQLVATAERREVGADRFDLESGDVPREMPRVEADVPDGRRDARDLGIEPPHADPRRAGEPPLRILGDDLLDLAELALAHQLARLLHHRVAGVVVRQREHGLVLRHEAAELLGVLELSSSSACRRRRGSPASMNAFAISKCATFGVTIVTKSIRSPSGSLLSPSTISRHDP